MIPVTDEFGLYVQLKKPSVKNDIKPIKMQQTLKHFISSSVGVVAAFSL